MANKLYVSIKTVQFHLTKIYAKLALSSRAELVTAFRNAAGESDGGDPGR